MRALFSVYDPVRAAYRVYAAEVADRHPALGPAASKPPLGGDPPLGVAAEDVLTRLPAGAVFVEWSPIARGRVAVAGDAGFGAGGGGSLAVIAALALAAWLWHRRRKRRR